MEVALALDSGGGICRLTLFRGKVRGRMNIFVKSDGMKEEGVEAVGYGRGGPVGPGGGYFVA